MKRVVKWAGLMLLILGLPAFSHAQAIYSNSCPSATTPIIAPSTTTIDNTTGLYKHQLCVDNLGNVYYVGTIAQINNVQWAGPGATPTIDQAVTACGSNPCTVMISMGYTGPESTNLITTSMGYRVYGGASTITIIDLRQNEATPGNPTAAPLYSIIFGGRQAGALNRIGANFYSNSPIDSTSAGGFFNWVTGTLPTNNGAMIGTTGTTLLTGSITVGAWNSLVNGVDGEAYNNATSSDGPVPYLAGFTGQAGISRTNAAVNVGTATAYYANGCANVSTSGATIANCYGFDAEPQIKGTTRNYSYHSKGNFLFEDLTRIDAVDTGGTLRQVFTFSNGFARSNRDFTPATSEGAFLGNVTNPWAGITVGNCSSSASPAVCNANAAGSVTIAAGATTKVVNTTAVTANSQIFIQEDDSLGTKLGVTCNTTAVTRLYEVTARVAGTSFTITTSAAPVTNPACLSFMVIN